MKKTTKKRPAKKSVAVFQTSEDAKTALLIVSLLANIFVLSLWVAVRVTDQYDAALASFFFNR